ncbi:ROK family protein [Corynebacterium choanae]|uniref:Glucokinase n=1 Tax=Corynebacterium choanae TaxID=1862358 RepID=A0A3G6J5E7_9CORY|nr:ROK family protein [Corynebacterium choanae]AZA13315.1 Glucokinase [Corynebacterium choanae]
MSNHSDTTPTTASSPHHTTGQPPTRHQPTQSLILGIDVGGTNIKRVIATAVGEILHESSTPTPQGGPNTIETAIVAAVGDLETIAHRDGLLTGEATIHPTIGVCVPGIVDESTGVAIHSANLHWDNLPLQARLTDTLARPVRLGHDVRTGARGEFRFGAGKHREHGCYIAIGTGIYLVTVIAGTPLAFHPWTGEIGQLPVPDPDAPTHTRTVETLCSAAGMARRVRALDPQLLPPQAGAKEVFALAAAGNPVAQHCVDDAIDYLATIIAHAAAILGPVPMVIGGGLRLAGSQLFSPLQAALAARCTAGGVPELIPAELGNLSQALGCVALATTA